MKKHTASLIGGIIGVFILTVSINSASAHVVVKPAQATPAAFQTFTISVPVEKEIPTIGLRLVVPEGLNYVTPNVKPGWRITIKKEGDKVTEIVWTGGAIPAGQRDEFLFNAQLPATSTSVAWKAYQTYRDGSVVAWDKDPMTEGGTSTPYSQTSIEAEVVPTSVPASGSSTTNLPSLIISIIAVAISTLALNTARKNQNPTE